MNGFGIPTISLGGGNVDNAELQYLDGVTAPIQTQLNGRARISTYTAGRYYRGQAINNNLTSSFSISANTMYAVPFYNHKSHTFDREGIRITTAVDTAKIRFGIYTSTNGAPDALVLDSGEYTMSGVGAQDAEVTISQTLPEGNYWLVMVSNTAVTGIGAATSAGRPDLGEASLTATIPYNRAEIAQAYGALPATFGVATMQTGGSPGIKLRAA